MVDPATIVAATAYVIRVLQAIHAAQDAKATNADLDLLRDASQAEHDELDAAILAAKDKQ